MMRAQQDQQSRMFYELSTLVLNILRSSPVPISLPDHPSAAVPMLPSRPSPSLSQITPAGFASLLLGISVALMLCGSVTFFLGFFLMPWVFGLVMVLYVAGIVSTLKMLGRSFLCYATSPAKPRKDIPGMDKNKAKRQKLDQPFTFLEQPPKPCDHSGVSLHGLPLNLVCTTLQRPHKPLST